MCTKSLKRIAVFALLALIGPGTALAKTCTVTSAMVAFGSYNPTASIHVDTIGVVTLDCDGSFNAVLSIDVGSGAGAGYARGRKMTNADGNTLRYNLYASASRTQVLGDGTGGSVTLRIKGQKVESQAIWARIPANQRTAFAGSYSDTLMATISY